MKQQLERLLLITYRGAVRGGKEALFPALPTEWLEPLTRLDSAVNCPPYGTEALWWKQWLRRIVPSGVFDAAMLELLTRQPVIRSAGKGPAYASAGRGIVCIEGKMVCNTEEAFLPRLIRTKEGREVLQHQLIKEREDERTAATRPSARRARTRKR